MNRKINKKKIFILCMIAFMLLLVILLSILYKKNDFMRSFIDQYIFQKNIAENDLPKIYIDTPYVYSFNDYVVYLDKSILHFYNKLGNEVSSLDINISNPIFKANGKYLCIAEKNGSNLYLINNKTITWQKNVEGKISNIYVNKNGYVAISISDTTYKTICKVLNNNGNDLFTTYLSKSYIVASSISDDNKNIALAEANFSGIAIQSNIRIISIENALNENEDSITFNYSAPVGDFITNIQYCGSNLVCNYDNHTDIICNNSVQEIENFETSSIIFSDINNKLIQVKKYNSGIISSQFELQIIDPETLQKKTYRLDKEPKSIEVFDNIIAINFGTEALFINNSAWLIRKYTSSQEIQSIFLSNNLAAIKLKNKIEILDL